MILTKEVSVKINKKYIDKHKKYTKYKGQIINIPVSDLLLNSTIKVEVKCDICGEIRNLEYRLYLKNYKKYNIYTCYNCSKIKTQKTNFKKYGVENPMQNKEIKEKVKKTCLEKYGVKYFLQSDIKKEKTKETCLKKYGVENPMQDKNIQDKSKKLKKEKYGENYEKIVEKTINTKKKKYGENYEKIIEKIKETNKLLYNCDFPLQNKEIYKKCIKTIFEKYGGYATENKEIREKQILTLRNTTFNNIKEKYRNINFIDKNNNTYTIFCDKCNKNYEISIQLFHLRNLYDTELCTNCNKIGNNFSGKETQLLNFIKENYNGKIIENDRKILNGKELDIYLPELNLAFEFNGVYWHSELYKDKNYHLRKTKLCEEKGIQLLHIWDDDWNYKQKIIKSIILNKLNKTTNKIYARKCKIEEITNIKLIKSFLNNNHIQGYSKSNKKIGLFYNDELVSLMTFGKRNINGNEEYELIRFCNKIDTNVIGGANKLFNYFIKTSNSDIISYSDNSIFNGDLYKKLGFEYIKNTELNYYWIVNNKKEHRFKYNKKKLISIGFDKNKTEKEIMYENGHYRVWSCGMKKWIYKHTNS